MAPDAARRRARDGAPPPDLALQLGVLPDTSEILANAGPFGTQVGFGAVAGYCAGVALRVAGTAGLALAGAGFVALQGLQYKGYVAVDWQKVERELRDTVRDISGASSEAASRRAMDEMAEAIKFGLPGAGGFSLGVAYGVGGVMNTTLTKKGRDWAKQQYCPPIGGGVVSGNVAIPDLVPPQLMVKKS